MNGFWITSDLHFHHKAILNFCSESRPFETVDEMDEAIINEWNSKVEPNHTIYHLGDFCWGSPTVCEEILSRLNGNIKFLIGNHDEDSRYQKVMNTYGEVVGYYDMINFENTKVVLCHYPIACWNGAHHGSIMLHGHTHNTFQNVGRSIDVGYDAQFEIISLDRAIELAKMRPIDCPDGHGKMNKKV